MSHLRFTPQEYRAIVLLCRPLELDDTFFPNFKSFLVTALLETVPELAKRVALFTPAKLRLLFDHVRGHKQEDRLTPEEFRALAHACASLVVAHRFLHYYRGSLIRHFMKTKPDLARKLTRMSEDQFRDIYRRVREGRKKG